MATSPGQVGRPNEDFIGAVPDAVVLLDGAGIPGTEDICRHGVAWYAQTLGATLLAGLTNPGLPGLVGVLADSIEQVAALHSHTCDIANPSSPQATVAAVKFEDDRVDYLVLADAFVVLDPMDAEPLVITDAREITVRDECTMSLRDLPVGSASYERARLSAVDALRARRNKPGGYWIAKDDPHAAAEAVTGSMPLEQLRGAALLSNGASRMVDAYRLVEWPEAVEVLRTMGPDVLLRRVREAETEGKASGIPSAFEPDDATAAYCNLTR